MGSLSFDYDGETAVVAGGTSGVGRAVALALGRAGAPVLVADGRKMPADEHASVPTHRVIREGGGVAEYVECDVSAPDDVETVFEAARDLGGADVLVTDVGVAGGSSITTFAPAAFGRLVERTVRGTFLATRAAARDMIDRGGRGAIVNVAPVRSTPAREGRVGPGAARAAVAATTRAAAFDLAENGIRVNAVVPGGIAAKGAAGRTADGALPLGRVGAPEAVVPAVLFLTSEAAGYVTGELLSVDGARTASRRSEGRSDSESST